MFLRRKIQQQASDEALVAQLRRGDRNALGDLWDRYAHLLFGVGMKYLKDVERSKDEVVELFTGLPELLARHEVERFRPWVHTVMRNRCLMALRNERHVRGTPDLGATDPEADTMNEQMLREAGLEQLEKAIEQLNDGQRTCIRLFYLQHKSYQQVAEQTAFAIDQVRSHLQNGRRNLRIILQRHADRNTT